MLKKKYIFVQRKQLLLPQDMNAQDCGAFLSEMIKNNFVILPLCIEAPDSRKALEIYEDKIKENPDLYKMFFSGELINVK